MPIKESPTAHSRTYKRKPRLAPYSAHGEAAWATGVAVASAGTPALVTLVCALMAVGVAVGGAVDVGVDVATARGSAALLLVVGSRGQKEHERHLQRVQCCRANLLMQKVLHCASLESPLKEELHAKPSGSPAGTGGAGGMELVAAPFLPFATVVPAAAAAAIFSAAAAPTLRVVATSGEDNASAAAVLAASGGAVAAAGDVEVVEGAEVVEVVEMVVADAFRISPPVAAALLPPVAGALALLELEVTVTSLLLLLLLSVQPEQTTPAAP